MGGWGIKDLGLFNRALCAKSLWRALLSEGLWGRIIRMKYLKRLPVHYFLCDHTLHSGEASTIWRSLLKSLPVIQHSIAWDVGRGTLVTVGIDPIPGLSDSYSLSPALVKFFHDKQLSVIRQFCLFLPDTQQRWLRSDELHLEGNLAVEWDQYANRLSQAGVRLGSLSRNRLIGWSGPVMRHRAMSLLHWLIILILVCPP